MMEETMVNIKVDDHSNKDNEVILQKILSKLPVKSLMRFKCVRRSWKSFIENDPNFIHLLPFYKGNEFCFMSANLFEGNAVIHTISNPGNSFTMLKPANGLICLEHRRRLATICIYDILSMRQVTPWIKSTIFHEIESRKKFVTVDTVLRHRPTFVLGFDPTTNEHKLICVWNMFRADGDRYNVCEVLTVGQNSWRKINDVPPCSIERDTSCCVNGSIYWTKCPRDVIVVFDLGTEKFRVIQIPEFVLGQPGIDFYELPNRHAQLLEVDGCVGLVHRMNADTVKMWIFDDNKEHSSSSNSYNWIEETILLPFGPGPRGSRRRRKDLCDYSFDAAVAGTDQLIMSCYFGFDFIVYSYDRKTKIFKEIEISGWNLFSSDP